MAVLDATIEAIVRFGYSGATSTRIAEISGFTRGAQIHHFRNKATMVTEALLHLHERLMNDMVGDLEAAARVGIGPMLDALWQSFLDELYTAAAELRVAARSDEELKAVLVPAEREIGRRIRDLLTAILDDGRHPKARLTEIAEHVVNTMRGMAEQHDLVANPERERRQLAVLNEAVTALLG